MENLIISFPISLIIFVSSLVQGATGFGFGVIAIPLLTTFCLSPEIALPLSATAAVTQSLYGVVRFRKIINIKEILILSLYCNAGMVMGVLTLHEITRFNQGLFGIIIGIILLVIVSVKTFLKIEPRDIVSWYWGAAALSMGGYICGLAGVGGPDSGNALVRVSPYDNPSNRLVLLRIRECRVPRLPVGTPDNPCCINRFLYGNSNW